MALFQKHIMARPTDYKPEYCDHVIEWGAAGKSVTWMAASLDVSRDTIYEWVKVHAEFSDAITRAKAKAQAKWEDMGEMGCTMPGFNGSVWAKSMAARFPEEWRDNKAIELSGDLTMTNQTKEQRDAAVAAAARADA